MTHIPLLDSPPHYLTFPSFSFYFSLSIHLHFITSHSLITPPLLYSPPHHLTLAHFPPRFSTSLPHIPLIFLLDSSLPHWLTFPNFPFYSPSHYLIFPHFPIRFPLDSPLHILAFPSFSSSILLHLITSQFRTTEVCLLVAENWSTDACGRG